VTGPLTLELQGLMRPEVQGILVELGQDVTIRRFGEADSTARAFLYQLEEKTPRGVPVQQPEFHVTAWQGIFSHDAPIRSPGYTVMDASNRVFVPEADAEDPGDQGVALIVRLNPLVERTRLQPLTFTLPGPLIRQPETGNMIAGPGQPLSVVARLTHSNDPHVVQLVGADSASTAIIGRWGTLEHPTLTPSGLNYGSQCPLTVDGQVGTLTIMLAWPDEDLKTELQFGARWVGIWRVKKT
jgi:hypothetical protein